MKKVKTILATLGIMLTCAVPAFGLTINPPTNGSATTFEWDSTLGNHEVGVSRYYGGSNTYGYSWVDPTDNSKRCKTKVIIGGISFPWAYGVGYAQSSQDYRPGNVSVSESHGSY